MIITQRTLHRNLSRYFFLFPISTLFSYPTASIGHRSILKHGNSTNWQNRNFDWFPAPDPPASHFSGLQFTTDLYIPQRYNAGTPDFPLNPSVPIILHLASFKWPGYIVSSSLFVLHFSSCVLSTRDARGVYVCLASVYPVIRDPVLLENRRAHADIWVPRDDCASSVHLRPVSLCLSLFLSRLSQISRSPPFLLSVCVSLCFARQESSSR